MDRGRVDGHHNPVASSAQVQSLNYHCTSCGAHFPGTQLKVWDLQYGCGTPAKLAKFCHVVRSETGERRVAVFDDDGNERIDPVTGQPISVAHALEELKLFDARLAPAFNNGNGGNGS